MRLGLLLTAVHDARVAPEQQLDEHLTLARLADELGFDLLIAGQHFLSADLRFYQPLPYLAHLTALHPRMRVGTGIMLLPLLNPVDVAEQMATLDVLSGGKAVWGVGLGYADAEFRAFGIDRKTRAARFEESIEVVCRLWSGVPVDFQGQHFQIKAPASSVLPVQRPHPPIWVAGQMPAAVRRAARCGDGWYAPPLLSHTELRALRELHDEERNRLGRGKPAYFPLRREVFIGDDRRDALERVRPFAARRAGTYLDLGIAKVLPDDSTFGNDDAALEERFILGSAEDCAEQLTGLFAELGVTDFIVRVQWPGLPFDDAVRQLTLFGEGVLPQLANMP